MHLFVFKKIKFQTKFTAGFTLLVYFWLDFLGRTLLTVKTKISNIKCDINEYLYPKIGQSQKLTTGFTLVEMLIGTAIFVVLAMSVYQTYTTVLNAVDDSRVKITATALSNEQFEIMRNLPYGDVGTINGIPRGKVPASQDLIRDGKNFTVKTTIRSIDNPFDGTIGGTPNDLSPADYKLAQLEISCATCKNFAPLSFVTQIGPRDLESESTNGALFVKVFDADGLPISGASVHIEDNQVYPTLVVDDTTNNDGILEIVDAPPGDTAYEITVSKPGYSTEKTYKPADPANPNPIKPNATVALKQLTQISFLIGLSSTLNVSSVNETCTAVPSVNFTTYGTKLIGTSPDILKYNSSSTTDGAGKKTIDGLEWDSYNLTFNDTNYDLVGTIPLLPLILNSSSTQDFKLVVAPKDPNRLLVTVKDGSTGLPLSGANVEITKNSSSTSLITGRGFMKQTSWSGGSSQSDFTDPTKYFSTDGNIETNNPAGEISLKKTGGQYATSSYLISSTFDTGSASNFHQILWQPQNQPAESGTSSVLLQIATNNDKNTWNFYGPDGTSNTFYTTANQNIGAVHNNDRYLRYKIYLNSNSTSTSPTISDISFTFTSECVPPGQVFFTKMTSGTYNMTVSENGYQDYTGNVNINTPWQQKEVILTP